MSMLLRTKINYMIFGSGGDVNFQRSLFLNEKSVHVCVEHSTDLSYDRHI